MEKCDFNHIKVYKNEIDFMNEVRLELSKRGNVVFRGNVGKVLTIDGKYFSTGLPTGFSDLFGVTPEGKAFFIETKIKPNTPLQEQVLFLKRMRKQGALCGVAYTMQDALDILREENK